MDDVDSLAAEGPHDAVQLEKEEKLAGDASAAHVDPDTSLDWGTQPPASNDAVPASTAPDTPSLLFSPTPPISASHSISSPSVIARDDISNTLNTAPAQPTPPDASRQEPQPDTPAPAPTPDTMSGTEIKEGDEVSWQWSGGRPGGTAAEVKEQGEVAIESKRGNTIKKSAEPGNPAVHIERPGNDVVKKASELDIEEKGDGHKEGESEEKKDEAKQNGDAATGDKRKADEPAEDAKDEAAGAKKAKTEKAPKANGEKKKAGRPAKKAAANGESAAKKDTKKETKKREPKKAATESGEPRRSGRNASKSE